MMKKIPLSRNMDALVDDEDYEMLSKYKWYATKGANTYYAIRHNPRNKEKQTLTLMHRFILNVPDGMVTDHIDQDGLNNQKHNLRICTRTQNNRNMKLYNSNTSGYRGVYYDNRVNKWYSHIQVNGVALHIGMYFTKEDAAMAYNDAAIKHHGDFASLNIV